MRQILCRAVVLLKFQGIEILEQIALETKTGRLAVIWRWTPND
jgi:hypothetical protein